MKIFKYMLLLSAIVLPSLVFSMEHDMILKPVLKETYERLQQIAKRARWVALGDMESEIGIKNAFIEATQLLLHPDVQAHKQVVQTLREVRKELFRELKEIYGNPQAVLKDLGSNAYDLGDTQLEKIQDLPSHLIEPPLKHEDTILRSENLSKETGDVGFKILDERTQKILAFLKEYDGLNRKLSQDTQELKRELVELRADIGRLTFLLATKENQLQEKHQEWLKIQQQWQVREQYLQESSTTAISNLQKMQIQVYEKAVLKNQLQSYCSEVFPQLNDLKAQLDCCKVLWTINGYMSAGRIETWMATKEKISKLIPIVEQFQKALIKQKELVKPLLHEGQIWVVDAIIVRFQKLNEALTKIDSMIFYDTKSKDVHCDPHGFDFDVKKLQLFEQITDWPKKFSFKAHRWEFLIKTS